MWIHTYLFVDNLLFFTERIWLIVPNIIHHLPYCFCSNGVVWLPITLRQFNSLFRIYIGCSIQPGQCTIIFSICLCKASGFFEDCNGGIKSKAALSNPPFKAMLQQPLVPTAKALPPTSWKKREFFFKIPVINHLAVPLIIKALL